MLLVRGCPGCLAMDLPAGRLHTLVCDTGFARAGAFCGVMYYWLFRPASMVAGGRAMSCKGIIYVACLMVRHLPRLCIRVGLATVAAI